MNTTRNPVMKYVLIALLGALGGGLLMVLITRAIPKMRAGMMAHRSESCCNCGPAEMCAKMGPDCCKAQPEVLPKEKE